MRAIVYNRGIVIDEFRAREKRDDAGCRANAAC